MCDGDATEHLLRWLPAEAARVRPARHPHPRGRRRGCAPACSPSTSCCRSRSGPRISTETLTGREPCRSSHVPTMGTTSGSTDESIDRRRLAAIATGRSRRPGGAAAATTTVGSTRPTLRRRPVLGAGHRRTHRRPRRRWHPLPTRPSPRRREPTTDTVRRPPTARPRSAATDAAGDAEHADHLGVHVLVADRQRRCAVHAHQRRRLRPHRHES